MGTWEGGARLCLGYLQTLFRLWRTGFYQGWGFSKGPVSRPPWKERRNPVSKGKTVAPWGVGDITDNTHILKGLEQQPGEGDMALTVTGR